MSLVLPSRFFLAPINTGYAEYGIPTRKLIEFHEHRSGNMIGVTYVGNVAVEKDCRTNDGTAVISEETTADWTNLASLIADRGSVPAMQLACKIAPIASDRRWVCPNPEEKIETYRRFISELSTEQIYETCNSFIRAASLAAAAKFKVVQIHAAHGYLLALLLNRLINTRHDDFFDGTFALKYISQQIVASNPDLKLDVRVSLFDGVEDSENEFEYRMRQIENLTGSYWMLSLSAGTYDFRRELIYPSKLQERPYLDYAVDLATKFPDSLWNVAGRLAPIAKLDQEVRGNVTFSIGRPLIADPQFVVKSLTGRTDEIVECAFCCRCHYFTRGTQHIECGVNPNV